MNKTSYFKSATVVTLSLIMSILKQLQKVGSGTYKGDTYCFDQDTTVRIDEENVMLYDGDGFMVASATSMDSIRDVMVDIIDRCGSRKVFLGGYYATVTKDKIEYRDNLITVEQLESLLEAVKEIRG